MTHVYILIRKQWGDMGEGEGYPILALALVDLWGEKPYPVFTSREAAERCKREIEFASEYEILEVEVYQKEEE